MDCYDERVCERVASLIEGMLRSGKGRTFKDVELSSICNAFSRITIASFAAKEHNEGMCNRILVMTERLMMRIADAACELDDFGLRPAASMLNAFAKLGLRHESSLAVVASKVRSSGGDMPLADAVQMYHAAASLNYLDEGMQAVLSRVIGAASPQDFSLQVRLDEGSRRHPRTERFVCLLVAKTCITLAPCTKLLSCKVANNCATIMPCLVAVAR